MDVHSLIEKTEKFHTLPQKEQIKLMAFFYCLENDIDTFETKHVRDEFIKNKLSIPSGITSLVPQMSKSKPPIFLKINKGYTLHRNIKKELEKNYCEDIHEIEVSSKLRDLLAIVKSIEQKNFLEEAIKCFEVRAYRASIILCWLLTMDVLYEYALKTINLGAFNLAIQSHGKYKKLSLSKKDDFSDIKESDFIELLRVSKLISNDIRKILDEKLGIRNSTAHPNSIQIDDYKAIAFIQDLINNVVNKYQ